MSHYYYNCPFCSKRLRDEYYSGHLIKKHKPELLEKNKQQLERLQKQYKAFEPHLPSGSHNCYICLGCGKGNTQIKRLQKHINSQECSKKHLKAVREFLELTPAKSITAQEKEKPSTATATTQPIEPILKEIVDDFSEIAYNAKILDKIFKAEKDEESKEQYEKTIENKKAQLEEYFQTNFDRLKCRNSDDSRVFKNLYTLWDEYFSLSFNKTTTDKFNDIAKEIPKTNLSVITAVRGILANYDMEFSYPEPKPISAPVVNQQEIERKRRAQEEYEKECEEVRRIQESLNLPSHPWKSEPSLETPISPPETPTPKLLPESAPTLEISEVKATPVSDEEKLLKLMEQKQKDLEKESQSLFGKPEESKVSLESFSVAAPPPPLKGKKLSSSVMPRIQNPPVVAPQPQTTFLGMNPKIISNTRK